MNARPLPNETPPAKVDVADEVEVREPTYALPQRVVEARAACWFTVSTLAFIVDEVAFVTFELVALKFCTFSALVVVLKVNTFDAPKTPPVLNCI